MSCEIVYRGPKHEKIAAEIDMQIRPVWIDELETRLKTFKKIYGWGLKLIFL